MNYLRALPGTLKKAVAKLAAVIIAIVAIDVIILGCLALIKIAHIFPLKQEVTIAITIASALVVLLCLTNCKACKFMAIVFAAITVLAIVFQVFAINLELSAYFILPSTQSLPTIIIGGAAASVLFFLASLRN
jgi:hypothetical protein